MLNPNPVAAQRPLVGLMPWSLRSWPQILWQADESAPAGFQHLSTRVMSADPGRPHRQTGQTLWACTIAGIEAGMAWDWVEIASGVVAMSDPLSVVTNLRIVGDEGEVLTSHAAARVLNNIVHALPWQSEVGRALAAPH